MATASTVTLTNAQIRALQDFEFGHGYGERAYLSRTTAKVLARMGLVTLSSKQSLTGRKLGWGEITDDGRQVLRQIRSR